MLISNLIPVRKNASNAKSAPTEIITGGYSPITPVPFDQWPAWAKAFAAMKVDGETGVGETAHRLFHWPVASQFSDVVFAGLALFKRGCGCVRRQAEWNDLYPYHLTR